MPVIANKPLFVTAPVEVTDNAPLAVIVFRITAPVAFTVTLLAVKFKAPVKALEVFDRDTSYVPVVMVVVPPIVKTAVSVTAPPAATDRLPVVVIVPSVSADFDVTTTTAPVRLTAPVKLLDELPSVILAVPAAIIVVPPMLSAPVSVTAVVDVTDRLPVSVDAPRTIGDVIPETVALEPTKLIAPV